MTKDNYKVVADNRRARFDYFIKETLEAGIILTGTEVKSLREGRGSIKESHAGEKNGELFLMNAHIDAYSSGGYEKHSPKRFRKLLLKRKERNRLFGAIKKEGITLVPLQIYFNHRGIAKVLLGLAAGKKQHDKRESEKERDWKRSQSRLLRDKG